ncbi:MAG: hypothetical protein ACRD2F_09875 [Terriglobales bacterium]
MRWVLVCLGILTFLLAILLAKEGQWWIAVPDGAFGLGIAWIAWEGLHAPGAGAVPAPVLRATPVMAAPEPPPLSPPVVSRPAPVNNPAAPKNRPTVPSAKRRKKNRR